MRLTLLVSKRGQTLRTRQPFTHFVLYAGLLTVLPSWTGPGDPQPQEIQLNLLLYDLNLKTKHENHYASCRARIEERRREEWQTHRDRGQAKYDWGKVLRPHKPSLEHVLLAQMMTADNMTVQNLFSNKFPHILHHIPSLSLSHLLWESLKTVVFPNLHLILMNYGVCQAEL